MPEDKKANQSPTSKSTVSSNDPVMGVLAYLGILVLIPLLAAKDSDFAQYFIGWLGSLPSQQVELDSSYSHYLV